MQVFDNVFDEVPALTGIDGVRILPLDYPPGYKWMPKSIDDYVPSFDSYLRSVIKNRIIRQNISPFLVIVLSRISSINAGNIES